MSSFIILILIAYFIKRGMIDGRGFSDLAKVFSGIVAFIILVSILTSPAFWIILGLLFLLFSSGIIAAIIHFAGKKRAEKYGWDSEEYQRKYAAAVNKFKEIYKAQREEFGGFSNMNSTQKRKKVLDDEKRAREEAAREVDAEFRAREAQMRQNGKAESTSYDDKKNRAKNTIVKSQILPKTSSRRSKIVTKFNNQYELFLTNEQIRRIVDASYMSNAWKREVEDMSQKYDSVYQWLHGDTAYLRAYLRAFTVQDITSDFKMQMQIVMDSFEEVFTYSDSLSMLSISARIDKINDKFMTRFDEITYMIAYRYLEQLGLKHKLDKTTLNRVDGTFDDLVQKYENMSTTDADSELETVSGQTKA